MIKVKAPIPTKVQEQLDSSIISLQDNKVYRMLQCMTCKQSFKRSQGVLLLSGFYCDEHNPCNDIHDTYPGCYGEYVSDINIACRSCDVRLSCARNTIGSD